MEAIEVIEYKGFSIKIYADDSADNPFEMDDGWGDFFHWKDYGIEQEEKYCELLGYNIETREKIKEDNPLAVRIDKYEHSCIYYSVEGEGTQCRWDTSHTWAVWFPNECLMEDIKRFKTKKTQRKRAVELAREACNTFNDWANGNVYGYVAEDKDEEQVGSCWGFFGDWEESGIIEQAKSEIDYEVKVRTERKSKKLKALVKNKVALDKREKILVN